MNNETLLKRLNLIKEQSNGEITELHNLICDIKNELLASGLKTSDKQRFKTCLNYCEKWFKHNARPILAYTHFENDLQYFTNCVFGVELHGADVMEQLPRTTENYDFKLGAKSDLYGFDVLKCEYPNMKNVFYRGAHSKEIDLEKLYQFVRVNKSEYFIFDFGNCFNFMSAESLLLGLTWFNGFKGKATLYYSDNGMKPILLEKENGTKLVICPCRLDNSDNHLTLKYSI